MRPSAFLSFVSIVVFAASQVAAAGVPQPVPLVKTDPATRAVVEKMTAAFGGASRLARLRSVLDVTRTTEKTKKGTRVSTRSTFCIPPAQIWVKLESERKATMVVTPFDSWIKGPDIPNGAAMRMPDDMRKDLLLRMDVDPLLVIARRNLASVRFALGERTTAGERPAETLHVRAGYTDSTWFVDAETGYILSSKSAETTTEYSDWRSVDGLNVPHRIVSTSAAGDTRTVLVTRFEIDMPYDEQAMFGTPLAWFDPELDLSKTFDPYMYLRSLYYYNYSYYRW